MAWHVSREKWQTNYGYYHVLCNKYISAARVLGQFVEDSRNKKVQKILLDAAVLHVVCLFVTVAVNELSLC